MSIQLNNRIRELVSQLQAQEHRLCEQMAELHERMDRIEFRKKPGPKPRRLQEKMND